MQREHFPFLEVYRCSRSRTSFYYTIGWLIFLEDSPALFKTSMDPLLQVYLFSSFPTLQPRNCNYTKDSIFFFFLNFKDENLSWKFDWVEDFFSGGWKFSMNNHSTNLPSSIHSCVNFAIWFLECLRHEHLEEFYVAHFRASIGVLPPPLSSYRETSFLITFLPLPGLWLSVNKEQKRNKQRLVLIGPLVQGPISEFCFIINVRGPMTSLRAEKAK